MLVDVVGVTFVEGYPDNLHRLADAANEAGVASLPRTGEPIAAVLVREPDNAADPNAVAVHIPAIGKIGHLARPFAYTLAPRIDAGERFSAGVVLVRIHPDHPERPGITVAIKVAEGARA